MNAINLTNLKIKHKVSDLEDLTNCRFEFKKKSRGKTTFQARAWRDMLKALTIRLKTSKSPCNGDKSSKEASIVEILFKWEEKMKWML